MVGVDVAGLYPRFFTKQNGAGFDPRGHGFLETDVHSHVFPPTRQSVYSICHKVSIRNGRADVCDEVRNGFNLGAIFVDGHVAECYGSKVVVELSSFCLLVSLEKVFEIVPCVMGCDVWLVYILEKRGSNRSIYP